MFDFLRRLLGISPAPAPAPLLRKATEEPKEAIPIQTKELIIHYEGFRGTAYMDEKDGWTIGYGTMFWPDGRKVLPGETCTREQAWDALLEHVREDYAVMCRLVHVPLKPHQVGALLSLIYNIGPHNFSTSTVLTRINAWASQDRIKDAWEMWIKDDGKVVLGLQRRRRAEFLVWHGFATYAAINQAERDFPSAKK